MIAFALLLSFEVAGLLLNAAGVPLPTNVIGLLLLAGALATGAVKAERVRPASDVLLRHIILFFVPAVAGIVQFGPQLRHQWPAVVGATVGGVVAATLAAGWTADALVKAEDAAEPAAVPSPEAGRDA